MLVPSHPRMENYVKLLSKMNKQDLRKIILLEKDRLTAECPNLVHGSLADAYQAGQIQSLHWVLNLIDYPHHSEITDDELIEILTRPVKKAS